MTEWVTDRERLRAFVYSDVVRNAIVSQRVFYPRRETSYLVDDADEMHALAAIEKPADESDAAAVAIQASDEEAARKVIEDLPAGKYWFHLANENHTKIVRGRMRVGWCSSSWLLALSPGDLRSEQKHETKRIDPSWASKIAKAWESDWDATEYVRARIENGPSAGVFVDGELVAWSLTHFETDKVSAMGMLVVLPSHRGKGYAESVTIDVATQVLAAGRTPLCHIYEDNQASLAMSEGLGFKRVCTQVWGDGVTR
jgi:ribosomal protein S18 acetylase RimI-like enzyme